MTTTRKHNLDVEGIGPVEVTVAEDGTGHSFLLLHGGAGPQSVAGFADLLVTRRQAQVITPIHPGFGATPRPDSLDPVADFFALTLDQVAQFSYHDRDRFRIDPASMSEAQRVVVAGNRSSLATYGGHSMTDPSLRGRLANVTAPTLVLWGESDQIVDPEYGRAYAAAIPGATFILLTATGHMPQLETPEQLRAPIGDFAEATASR